MNHEAFNTSSDNESRGVTLTRRQLFIGAGALAVAAGMGGKLLAGGSNEQTANSAPLEDAGSAGSEQLPPEGQESGAVVEPGNEQVDSSSSNQLVRSPDIFADRTDRDPETVRQVAENGTYEELVALFNIPLGEEATAYQTAYSEFIDTEAFKTPATLFGEKLEMGLNAGRTLGDITPYLEKDDKRNYVADMINKYDMAAIQGMFGMEGTRIGWGDRRGKEFEYSPEWIKESDYAKAYVAIRRSVLNAFYERAAEHRSLDQTIRVRTIEVLFNQRDSGNDWYSTVTKFGVIDEVDPTDPTSSENQPEIIEAMSLGFHINEEFGIYTVSSVPDTELFQRMETELK